MKYQSVLKLKTIREQEDPSETEDVDGVPISVSSFAEKKKDYKMWTYQDSTTAELKRVRGQ